MLPIFLSAFALGFLHSLEPDHIVAVSTIVARCKNLFHSILAGILWGVGHALVIILASLLIFYAKGVLSENIFTVFEFFVGVMLVYLGYRLLRSTIGKNNKNLDSHSHDHSINEEKPITSLLVGSLHGLAGSGAIIALFFSEFSSLSQSLISVLSFGFGNIVSMALASLFLGFSLHYYRLGRFGYLERGLQGMIGSCAIIFGVYKMLEVVL
jgi:ABC-type nickel/cobalt efflux system permease component RcnA